jgi:hypothetical protein
MVSNNIIKFELKVNSIELKETRTNSVILYIMLNDLSIFIS